jgi:hypothetical protein
MAKRSRQKKHADVDREKLTAHLFKMIDDFARLVGVTHDYVIGLIERGILSNPIDGALKSTSAMEPLLSELLQNPHRQVSQAEFARVIGRDRSVVTRLKERGVFIESAGFQTNFHRCCAYGVGVESGRKGSGFFS